jgi:hypothetical protein
MAGLPSMKVAMMQPAFLPWQGFFELIFRSDCFIFLNDFQFSVQSFHQRNKLFTNLNQVDWYTVPVKKSSLFGVDLNQALIDEASPWRRKMINRLRHNYSKTPYFDEIFPLVEKTLNAHVDSLSEMNILFIRSVIDFFEWKKELRFSSDFKTDAIRSEKVVQLLRWCGGTQYYSARGAYAYMGEDGLFPLAEVEVFFQNFSHGSYSQAGSPGKFVPSLSILDALFNVGRMETLHLIENGTRRWHAWREMPVPIASN